MHVEQLRGNPDTELTGVSLGNAVHFDSPSNEIKRLLRRTDLFQLDEAIFRPDYLAFALRFGPFEDR
ncbi:hypothetical protein D3C80_1518570 [compost metagenome]